MDLKERVRHSRELARRKEPFPLSRFALVGALLRHYGLGRTFLELWRTMTPKQAEELACRYKAAAKPVWEPPLFFLASPEEWDLIQAILASADNPYLDYVRSPEELLLAPFLWRRRPDLSPETLSCRHFGFLYIC